MTYIRVVTKNAATNPIARAVARQKLKSLLLTSKISLYMMTPEDEYRERLEAIGATLEPMIVAARIETTDRGTKLEELIQTMQAGKDVCVQLLTAGTYDPMQARVICDALDAAEEVNPRVNPEAMQKALYSMYASGHN
jgi:hypothetical protein